MSDEDGTQGGGDDDDMAAAMAEIAAEEEGKKETLGDVISEVAEDIVQENGMIAPKDVEAIYDIPVQISAVLGHSTMQVNQLLKLGRGAVVELDRKVGEAIDIYVNNRLVARGEVVVDEDRLGVTMTEIVKSDRSH